MLRSLEQQTLLTQKNGYCDRTLRPGDMKCRWEGTLEDGIVTWRPSFVERVLRPV